MLLVTGGDQHKLIAVAVHSWLEGCDYDDLLFHYNLHTIYSLHYYEYVITMNHYFYK